VTVLLNGRNAQAVYNQIAGCLTQPEFRPRSLSGRFHIRMLCTTDAATDSLSAHARLRASGWKAGIRPTFRPDALVNLQAPGKWDRVEFLGQSGGVEVVDYASFVRAREERRRFFKPMGAAATDHAVETARTEQLIPSAAATVFRHALEGQVTRGEAARFAAHMLIEMARMSIEDGLVLQIHPERCATTMPLSSRPSGQTREATSPCRASSPSTCAPCSTRSATTLA